MVGVAQLVERWIVIPVVVGSIPIVHPIFLKRRLDREIGRLLVLGLCGCGAHVAETPEQLQAMRLETHREVAEALGMEWEEYCQFNEIDPE